MKTVLVVDDEMDIADAVKSILEDEGYRVVTCANGREALDCLEEVRPDLIIIDVMMPVMNGFEALRAIRQREEFAGLPVLIMSAIDPSVRPAEYDWAGFLKKPFSLSHLLEQVHKLVPLAA
ncbi:response regulator [Myxococcus sp. MISCRS1]|jgi:CheY-like chemotaxis protein|uniref:response regulator n=1 Tax=Myxococcus TaxID=32 RepID=UPI00114380D4|nr:MULTISPECIES: response regulator [Myxococcus]BDT32942.1 response regulator [Myxococcus sp. MH1]MBZ4401201.1 response regulator [Myxococcus sp. AS-1-15]MBZ4411012.1 response regulator [Myxococcus sp. XM-1-1-1]MCK8503961.1 response regulator [Myxococcus fulvus]MCY0997040.1 response regulator [Myxococcus sp. MISCRS1]